MYIDVASGFRRLYVELVAVADLGFEPWRGLDLEGGGRSVELSPV